LEISHSLFLALADSMVFVVANQGVRYIAECSLDRLSIADQRLPVLKLGISQVVAKVAALEEGLAQARPVAVDPFVSRDVAAEDDAVSPRSAAGAGQRSS